MMSSLPQQKRKFRRLAAKLAVDWELEFEFESHKRRIDAAAPPPAGPADRTVRRPSVLDQ